MERAKATALTLRTRVGSRGGAGQRAWRIWKFIGVVVRDVDGTSVRVGADRVSCPGGNWPEHVGHLLSAELSESGEACRELCPLVRDVHGVDALALLRRSNIVGSAMVAT